MSFNSVFGPLFILDSFFAEFASAESPFVKISGGFGDPTLRTEMS